MRDSLDDSDKTPEQGIKGLRQDKADDPNGEAPSTNPASEEQRAPVYPTSAFKPDPFW